MADIRTIGICTGGGDCPGLNAVIRAAVKSAKLKYGWNVIGVQDGFDGLIWPKEKTRMLEVKDVSGILPRGGTILGTTNRGNPFSYVVTEHGKDKIVDYSDQVVRNARELGMDALIVVGGDGTQKIGLDLQYKGLKMVGVPKTIDNDLPSTDVTFGFDTALHVATDAIDRIHTTAESHHRIMLVEVMGRDAGWIALEAGIAGGSHVILIPEIPFEIASVVDFVRKREEAGKRFTIVVVAEGVQLPPSLENADTRRDARKAGVANVIGEAIAQQTKRETRVAVLGHIQRGGSPSPFDRILSTRFGVAAVELIAEGRFGHMVCLRGDKILSVDLKEAAGRCKTVDPNDELVKVARSIGISFGD